MPFPHNNADSMGEQIVTFKVETMYWGEVFDYTEVTKYSTEDESRIAKK